MKDAISNYIKSSVEEIRKVTWPTTNQAVRITIIVLVFTLVSAALIGLVDYLFEQIYDLVLF